ncbi:MAG TPA: hypothetical protein VET24_10615 [Actinomycetota bacterium]|nr:hypothetical protein [Actinomycetota bacterium]
MVIIKTTCPSCGEVDLTAEKVELRIAIGGTGSSYAFECPRCSDRVRKPADARVVQLLISGGVSPEVLPEELPAQRSAQHSLERSAAREVHPSSRARVAARPAPAITYDDLIEFHKELESGVLENFLRSAAA